MRSASSEDIQDEILAEIPYRSRCQPIVKIEYWSFETSEWIQLSETGDPLISFTINFNSVDTRYGKFSRVPVVSDASIVIDNRNGYYSSGAPKEIFVRNRRFRISQGYRLKDLSYEYIVLGEWTADAPVFVSSGTRTISVSLRSELKRAMESEVSCPSYASLTDCAVILRDVCDRAGILHDDGTELIPTTGYEVIIADDNNFINISAVDVFSEVMEYLQYKNSLFRFVFKDNYMQLITISTDPDELDYFTDEHHLTGISFGQSTERLLKNATIQSQKELTEVETLLAYAPHTDTATSQTITWSNDATYLRVIHSNRAGYTLELGEIDLVAKTLKYSVTKIGSGNTTVSVFGCEMTSTVPPQGTAIEYPTTQRVDSPEGFSYTQENRLVQTSDDAKGIAERLIADFGQPLDTIEYALAFPNPILEIGDQVWVFDRVTQCNNTFVIDSISLSYVAENCQFTQSISASQLTSTAPTATTWDEGGFSPISNWWDNWSRIWDLDLGLSAIDDPNTYPTPIRTIIKTPYEIEYLVVAGGGAGDAGGGGAGGLLNGIKNVIPGDYYIVTIGAGGSGAYNAGTKGSDSGFDDIIALGGGRSTYRTNKDSDYDGGSGAGGAVGLTEHIYDGLGGDTLDASQGNDGGDTIDATDYQCSGGGGAGEAGEDSVWLGPYIGHGGDGKYLSDYESVGGSPAGWFSGGGSGGQRNVLSIAGGQGGGGTGRHAASDMGDPSAGGVNTGGGGGGIMNPGGSSLTNGGSGIVIIRYVGTQRGKGGTVTTSGGYTHHTFITSGIYEV